ncbi:uncharacterized protein DEA37_0002312 [Paragonimus westermani]|uniref:Uncharacterized protein n=1 Tax=Paragonimus westermani TaxID=34504 RepID=A0A5J4NEE4_9TREM|nr:uncharacterized protein DEA37_0002312 [Paragonimus westermani]
MLQRVLHYILAKIVCDPIKFSSLQVAFEKKDRCLEAFTLLHTILCTADDEVKPIAIAFFDLSKAFDSVSHDTILRCARKHRLHPPVGALSIATIQRHSNHMG